MVVAPDDVETARSYLADGVDLLVAPLDDAWMRDIGPTFVLDDGVLDDGGPRLGAVDWVFNGWGQQDWASWGNDSKIGAKVAAWSGADRIGSELVNEGGGIQVDGEGTVLVTETVQLDPFRNPGMTKADVEAELERTIGARKVIWLPRGLTRDAERYGTRGHVDIVAAIPSPGTAAGAPAEQPGAPGLRGLQADHRFPGHHPGCRRPDLENHRGPRAGNHHR